MHFKNKYSRTIFSVFLLFFCSFFVVQITAQTTDFYYTTHGGKFYITKIPGKYLAEFPKGVDTTNPSFPLSLLGTKLNFVLYLVVDTTILSKYSNVYFVTPCYMASDSLGNIDANAGEVYYTRTIVLAFKDSVLQASRDKVINDNNLIFSESFASFDIYLASVGDALQISKAVYESGLVEFCVPDLIIKIKLHNSNGVAVNTTYKDDSIRMFPNPAFDYLAFDGANDFQLARIFNETGCMVKEQQFLGQKYRVQLSDLPAGLYYLQISTKKGMVYNKRFIHR